MKGHKVVKEIRGFRTMERAYDRAMNMLLDGRARECQVLEYRDGGFGVRGHQDIGLDARPSAPYRVCWWGLLLGPGIIVSAEPPSWELRGG